MFSAVAIRAAPTGRNLLSRFSALSACSQRCFSSGTGSTLVVADHDNSVLQGSTLNSIAAANKLGNPVTILVAGDNCDAVAQAASKIDGVSHVLVADSSEYANQVAENMTSLVQTVQTEKSFSHILTSTSAVGKGWVPRVGAKLDLQPISDIIDVKSDDTFVRPIYAGNAIATMQSNDSVKLITVRPTAFDAVAAEGGSATIENVAAAGDAALTSWVADELSQSDRPELGSARVVIAGGRGMQNGENFAMLEKLADLLGGAVGASRAAVDAGFVPNNMQIGQTGKVVAPELYIAVGISGAIQHLAGMKDSKTIVAINKDEEAAIFQVSDYGLVTDLFDAVPELTAALEK